VLTTITGTGVNSALGVLPAIIAAGTPGTCETAPNVAGTGTDWISLTNTAGLAIAEIKPGTNNLGTIQSSLYTSNATLREDAAYKTFLNRNVTITPGTQPSTPVGVRIYITEAEYQALKNNLNSQNATSGITSISNVQLYKSNTTCSGAIPGSLTAMPTIVSVWLAGGYVLETTVSSFSTFFVSSGSSTPLPISLLSIRAINAGSVNRVTWATATETGRNTLQLQRSADGRSFETIVTMAGKGNNSRYEYTDNSPLHGVNYYRLSVTTDGSAEHPVISDVVKATTADYDGISISVYPNPVADMLTVDATGIEGSMEVSIRDITGTIVRTMTLVNGKTTVALGDLPGGVYMLQYKNAMGTQQSIRIIR
jgi:hypothetical protein